MAIKKPVLKIQTDEEIAEHLYEMIFPHAGTGKDYFVEFPLTKLRFLAVVRDLKENLYNEFCERSKVYNGYGDRVIRITDLRKIFSIPDPPNPGC